MNSNPDLSLPFIVKFSYLHRIISLNADNLWYAPYTFKAKFIYSQKCFKQRVKGQFKIILEWGRLLNICQNQNGH